jgi:hypothetical protein
MRLATRWRDHFLENARCRVEPDWSLPCPTPVEVQPLLARSLARFQLGETGDGRHLLEQAALDRRSAGLCEPLALFIHEEQEHARLLGCLVRRYGGQTIGRHWTDWLFRRVRRAGGLELELTVLVIAEMVGTAYYRLLLETASDPVLQAVCRRILRDEAGHIEFHACHLGSRLAGELPGRHTLFSARIQLLLPLAARVAWIDHGRCLRGVGVGRERFAAAARRECIRFLRSLSARATRRALGPAAEAPAPSAEHGTELA